MRFPGRQLRSRIIWTTALVSGLAMAAMIGTAVLALNAVTKSNIDTSLRDRFVLDSSSIKDDPQGPKRALDSPLDSVEDSTWLYDSSGSQVLGPDAGRRVQAIVDGLSTTTSRTSVTRHERVYLAGPVTIGGPDPGPGVLVVAQNLEPYEDTRTEIVVGLVALGLLVTAGATAIAAWTMSRTLAPVESMAGLAEDWSETDLDERFDGLGSQNEIAHLGHTLNLLLDRVAGALRGEQRLTSELAHELRTPLTGIRGEIELALMADPEPSTRARLERVMASVDQMSSTITTLLAIARGDHQQQNSTTVAAVLSAAIDSRAPGVRVVEAPPDLRIGATTDIAVRALAPLVDNAQRYARAEVTVAVRAEDRTVQIIVTDDGPGVDEAVDDPESLFTAGTRAADSPGAGLGLSLARRVAQSLGGEVSVTSPRGPTSFTLTLPRR